MKVTPSVHALRNSQRLSNGHILSQETDLVLCDVPTYAWTWIPWVLRVEMKKYLILKIILQQDPCMKTNSESNPGG